MKAIDTNKIHLANKTRWDAAASNWAKSADSRGIWRKCHHDPSLVFSDKLIQALTGIKGKRVCVLGSGDNQAVFAFAGMGAEVTSVDISQNQLDIAAERASVLGFDITFIRQDVTDLDQIKGENFDLVYTGGHVAVWVGDLQKYYIEASRILKIGGRFIVDEYHPFRRVWQESKDQLIVENAYFERGPFEYMYGTDILYQQAGGFPSFEFHWTVGDFINAMIKAGCQIQEVEEYGNEAEDWEGAPMDGLPECLMIIAEKRGS